MRSYYLCKLGFTLNLYCRFLPRLFFSLTCPEIDELHIEFITETSPCIVDNVIKLRKTEPHNIVKLGFFNFNDIVLGDGGLKQNAFLLYRKFLPIK